MPWHAGAKRAGPGWTRRKRRGWSASAGPRSTAGPSGWSRFSRRPRRVRRRQWSEPLARRVEQTRAAYPMWGKRKIAAWLARQGLTASVSTVGRILHRLMERGRIIAVPILRRRPAAERWRMTATERYARRLPKGLRPKQPGELVQIDTLFVNVAPDCPVKHFTPTIQSQSGRSGTSPRPSRRAARAACSTSSSPARRSRFAAFRVDGGAEFRADFEQACRERSLDLFVLPPKRSHLNDAVERTQATWRYEFYACHKLPTRIDELQRRVDRFAITATTTGPIRPLAIKPRRIPPSPQPHGHPRRVSYVGARTSAGRCLVPALHYDVRAIS